MTPTEPADQTQDLPALATRIRLKVLSMIQRAGSSHIGSNFSMAELLAVLYGRVLRVDPARPDWDDRDRFILSKGHACAALYAVLAERRFFPEAWLDTFYLNGSPLAGHVTRAGVPGIEVSTGSLGHGLAIGVGMALAGQRDNRAHRVFVLMSDGECDEGSTWEAVLFAAHHRLSRLVAIVDYNKIQSLGSTEDVLNLEPFADKWRSFGWRVSEVDGHDIDAITSTLGDQDGRQPHCVIAHTVKGKGVSFMEGQLLWHYRSPQGEEYAAALRELERRS
ncbi:MAG: transketolase [Vicinamibacterales bacterium]